MRLLQIIFIILFFGFISFPWINRFIPIIEPSVSNENRALAKFPSTDTCKIDRIPFYLENYLVDRLSTRNNMIRFYNRLNIFTFRSSPAGTKAFIGKNGWMYLSGEEIRTFTGTELLSEEQLAEFKTEMLRRQNIISSYNAKLLIAIVPNKANIYPEHMPDHIIKSEHNGYGRQIHEYLKKNGLPVVDLYSILSMNKTPYDIYFKTDNHWNDLGAFIAAGGILKEMDRALVLDTLLYPVKIKKEGAGSVAVMLNIENETSDLNYSPTPIHGFKSSLNAKKKYPVISGFPYANEYEVSYAQKDSSLPDVLVIRDSFGKRLIPYLAEQCANCTAIWDAWHYGLNEEIIKDAKPDLVVYLIAESQLKNVMKFQKQETQ